VPKAVEVGEREGERGMADTSQANHTIYQDAPEYHGQVLEAGTTGRHQVKNF